MMILLQHLESVAERYAPPHRLAVTGFLAHCPTNEAFELFQSSPGLGLLLAYSPKFSYGGTDPWVEARDRMSQPRPAILEWLGFPASRSAVRIVTKIDVSRITLDRCLRLRDLLSVDAAIQRLRHLPAVCDGVVDMLSSERLRHLVAYSLLEELAELPDDDVVSEQMGTVLRLADLHGVELHTFRSCKSVIQSALALNLMESSVSPVWNRECESIDFPEPPIHVPIHTQPSDLRMEPIRSPRELFNEAVEQHICVFDYLDEVAAGDVAVYRIVKPERATVMLSPAEAGRWIIVECRGIRNRPIQRSTLWTVGAYLSRRQEATPETDRSDHSAVCYEKNGREINGYPLLPLRESDND